MVVLTVLSFITSTFSEVSPLPHRTVRSCATLATLLLIVGLFALVGGTGPASARPTAGVRNGDFDTSRAGWRVSPRHRASLSVIRAGRSGRGLLIRQRAAGTVRVRAARRIALAGHRGDRYALSGWVRGSRTGQRAVMIVREYRGHRVVRTARRAVVLRAGTWAPLRTGLVRARTRSTFQVQLVLRRGRPHDLLVLDQVRLVRRPAQRPTRPRPVAPTPPAPTPVDPTPVDPTPVDPTTGCFSARGVPACGPLLGSAYGSNTDPAAFETSIGHLLAIHRTYWRADQVTSAVNLAGSDLAHGRIPWISFKLPYSWDQMAAGAGDTWARDLATRLGALPGPVWIAFHHEPEGDGDITQWTNMQAHLAPLVRASAPNLAYTIILTGWNQLYGAAQYHLDNLWPKNTTVDIAGFDVYNSLGVVKNGVLNTKGTDLPSAYFQPLSTWAAAHGVAWGLAETGYTDYASEIDPHWIEQTFAAMSTYHGVAFTYFNTTLNSVAPWNLGTPSKLADYAITQAQSPMWQPN